MNDLRILIISTVLALGAGAAGAQTATAPPADAGKPQATASTSKKAAPRKAPKKKTAAKKPAKRANAPATAAGQAIVAPKGETVIHAPATITTGPAVLRDRDGNIIPTRPEAYNVESATGKQPPRR